jgi:predicted esterase
MRLATTLIVLLSLATAAVAGWTEDLDALLDAAPGPVRDDLLTRVLEAKPEWEAVVTHIRSRTFPAAKGGETLAKTVKGLDGVDRPYAIHVPSNYDPARPTPLLVVLHGGVSRPNLIEDPVAMAKEHRFHAVAERRGWLSVYPLGQGGATWWDEVGMTNIRTIIRATKRAYNVDDDRVWMEGFSDGGSAGLLHAMTVPTDYAGFVSLNGHMGTGSLIGELPIYAPNMANTPIYAVTTDDDELFPSRTMGPSIEMAREAGAEILYRQFEGRHRFTYADVEIPRIVRWLERHPRDPFPTRIVWETGGRAFGLCRWFAIDEVNDAEPADWHTDHNAILLDDRVSVGFYHDDTFEGPGMKVARVVEDSFAERVGLLAGDILIEANGTEIKTIEDLNGVKAGLRRGDELTIKVRRGEKEVTLSGKLPDAQRYFLFKRTRPSAKAWVSFSANRVDVEASRVGKFRVLIHPDLFRLERNVVVRVNGKTVHDWRVEPDLTFLLKNYLENRDRVLLYVAELELRP